MLSTQSSGDSLSTLSEVNKIGALKITDSSTKKLVGLNLGTADIISSVTLTFKNSITDGNTVNISLKNSNGVEIGSGSETVSGSPTIVIINPLTDSVTAIEHSTLRTVSVTVT